MSDHLGLGARSVLSLAESVVDRPAQANGHIAALTRRAAKKMLIELRFCQTNAAAAAYRF
jgi:hypothetical protein